MGHEQGFAGCLCLTKPALNCPMRNYTKVSLHIIIFPFSTQVFRLRKTTMLAFMNVVDSHPFNLGTIVEKIGLILHLISGDLTNRCGLFIKSSSSIILTLIAPGFLGLCSHLWPFSSSSKRQRQISRGWNNFSATQTTNWIICCWFSSFKHFKWASKYEVLNTCGIHPFR